MSKYHILEPLSYVKSGKVVFHLRPENDVQLDDDIAATLGDKVRKAGEPEAATPKEAPTKVAEKK